MCVRPIRPLQKQEPAIPEYIFGTAGSCYGVTTIDLLIFQSVICTLMHNSPKALYVCTVIPELAVLMQVYVGTTYSINSIRYNVGTGHALWRIKHA